LKETDLVVAGIAFRELSHQTLGVLEDVKIPEYKRSRERVERAFGLPLAEFAYVEKCNAVILVMAFEKPPHQSILNDCAKIWSNLTERKAAPHLSQMVSMSGLEACEYLLETSVGLHSVVVGDSQVYSQVREPIRSGANANSHSTFHALLRFMRKAEKKIRTTTKLHRGYTSLERLACMLVGQELRDNQAIAVVGLGSSGTLVTKIFHEERQRDVLVAARSQSAVDSIVSKYRVRPASLMPQDFVGSVGGIVLALDNNEDTRAYAEYLQGEIQRAHSVNIVVDLAAPPLISWALPGCRLADITTLSEMAQKVVSERAEYIEVSKRIIRGIIQAAFQEPATAG
jgi:glutamyl-tRNA reductase